MNLSKVLNLISSSLGFIGAIFLAKGVVKLSPQIMAKQVSTYWNFNKFQLESIIDQKSDFKSGIILISIAFLIQIINSLCQLDSISIFYWDGILISIRLSLFIWFIVIFYRNRIRKKYYQQTTRSLAQNFLKNSLKEKRITRVDYNGIKDNAKYILNFNKRDDESIISFIKRYAHFLDVEVPNDVDFEGLEE